MAHFLKMFMTSAPKVTIQLKPPVGSVNLSLSECRFDALMIWSSELGKGNFNKKFAWSGNILDTFSHQRINRSVCFVLTLNANVDVVDDVDDDVDDDKMQQKWFWAKTVAMSRAAFSSDLVVDVIKLFFGGIYKI